MAIKFGKWFGTDSLLGTDGDDLLVALGAKTTLDGGAGKDILLGRTNNDVLIGGKGADFLSGGLGIDTADYSASSAAITVNLTTGKGSGGDAQGDTLISIEKVIGSAFDDTLIGDKGNNSFTGGDGNDIFGMTGGKDTITDFKPSEVVLIDFQGIEALQLQAAKPVPNGYKDLMWDHTWFATSANSGYLQLIDFSGDYVGLTHPGALLGGPAIFSSPAKNFNLVSLDISGGQFDELLPTTIEVWDDGIVVGTVLLSATSGRVSVDFGANSAVGATDATFSGRFTSIDKVRFVDSGTANGNIAFDDIKIAFGDSDKIDVPIGTNIPALVASAVSDGNGGTLLTHSKGTLDLVGIDPGSVSADWFI